MKINNKKSGYDASVANMYINQDAEIYILSGLEPQYKFEDGKPTSEVASYRAWFSQNGLPPFRVKFLNEITVPKYLSKVKFKDLEGIEIRSDVFFRASDIVEAK